MRQKQMPAIASETQGTSRKVERILESQEGRPEVPEASDPRSEPLTRAVFLRSIVPALRMIPTEDLATAIGLSVSYCARIRAGSCVPHRRHWARVLRAVWQLSTI